MNTSERIRGFGLLAFLAAGLLLPGCVTGSKLLTKALNPISQPRSKLQDSDFRHPEEIEGASTVVYETGANRIQGKDATVLAAHAPIIVQGVLPEGKGRYDYNCDLIGTPELQEAESEDGYHVGVNVARPAVFGKVMKARVGEAELTQLVYHVWYRCCPAGLIEKGHIDGAILRLTMDAAHRPAIVEVLKPCGCYHTTLVSRRLEEAATREFADALPGKKYAVEKKVKNKTDWVIRRTVDNIENSRIVLFLGRGKHLLRGLSTVRAVDLSGFTRPVPYTLRNYDDLTRLPVAGASTGSMFKPDGLVWGGRRNREEKVFASVNHPGWPRRIDSILIHFDESRLADPTLLEAHLRLPATLTGPRNMVASPETRRSPGNNLSTTGS